VVAGSLSLGSLDLSALSSPSVIGGILYTGLISTALTVLLQTRALGKLPASDSSVIVATEPLWAAGFASILLNEQLEPSAQLGGGLIVLGCLSNTLLPPDLGLGELGLRRGDEEAEAGTAKAMEEETEQEAEAEEDLHL
jgi:drug/metabolite transporter (DMT)-like permease